MRVKVRSSTLSPIHAAVLREPGRALRIEKLEMEGPRQDEVLVRLVASGICHTDIDFCDSGGGGPAILGHEGAGVVERLGRSVKGVRVGDHVCTFILQDMNRTDMNRTCGFLSLDV